MELYCKLYMMVPKVLKPPFVIGLFKNLITFDKSLLVCLNVTRVVQTFQPNILIYTLRILKEKKLTLKISP